MQDAIVDRSVPQAAASLTFPGISPALHDPLTEVLRRGAVQLLTQAVEAEVEQWIAGHAHVTDAQGHRQVVRNGHAEPRTVVTGLGPVPVRMPRVHDRRTPAQGREHFTSNILPPYLRKARSIDELIPWLYLNREAPTMTATFGGAAKLRVTASS